MSRPIDEEDFEALEAILYETLRARGVDADGCAYVLLLLEPDGEGNDKMHLSVSNVTDEAAGETLRQAQVGFSGLLGSQAARQAAGGPS